MKKTSIFIKFLVIFTLLFSSIIKADNAMPNDCQHHNETQNMHTEMEMNHNNHSDMKHSMDCDNCCNEENKNNIHDCDICDNCNDFVNNVQILNNIYISLSNNKIPQIYYYSYKVKEPPFFKERIPPIFLS